MENENDNAKEGLSRYPKRGSAKATWKLGSARNRVCYDAPIKSVRTGRTEKVYKQECKKGNAIATRNLNVKIEDVLKANDSNKTIKTDLCANLENERKSYPKELQETAPITDSATESSMEDSSSCEPTLTEEEVVDINASLTGTSCNYLVKGTIEMLPPPATSPSDQEDIFNLVGNKKSSLQEEVGAKSKAEPNSANLSGNRAVKMEDAAAAKGQEIIDGGANESKYTNDDANSKNFDEVVGAHTKDASKIELNKIVENQKPTQEPCPSTESEADSDSNSLEHALAVKEVSTIAKAPSRTCENDVKADALSEVLQFVNLGTFNEVSSLEDETKPVREEAIKEHKGVNDNFFQEGECIDCNAAPRHIVEGATSAAAVNLDSTAICLSTAKNSNQANVYAQNKPTREPMIFAECKRDTRIDVLSDCVPRFKEAESTNRRSEGNCDSTIIVMKTESADEKRKFEERGIIEKYISSVASARAESDVASPQEAGGTINKVCNKTIHAIGASEYLVTGVNDYGGNEVAALTVIGEAEATSTEREESPTKKSLELIGGGLDDTDSSTGPKPDIKADLDSNFEGCIKAQLEFVGEDFDDTDCFNGPKPDIKADQLVIFHTKDLPEATEDEKEMEHPCSTNVKAEIFHRAHRSVDACTAKNLSRLELQPISQNHPADDRVATSNFIREVATTPHEATGALNETRLLESHLAVGLTGAAALGGVDLAEQEDIGGISATTDGADEHSNCNDSNVSTYSNSKAAPDANDNLSELAMEEPSASLDFERESDMKKMYPFNQSPNKEELVMVETTEKNDETFWKVNEKTAMFEGAVESVTETDLTLTGTSSPGWISAANLNAPLLIEVPEGTVGEEPKTPKVDESSNLGTDPVQEMKFLGNEGGMKAFNNIYNEAPGSKSSKSNISAKDQVASLAVASSSGLDILQKISHAQKRVQTMELESPLKSIHVDSNNHAEESGMHLKNDSYENKIIMNSNAVKIPHHELTGEDYENVREKLLSIRANIDALLGCDAQSLGDEVKGKVNEIEHDLEKMKLLAPWAEIETEAAGNSALQQKCEFDSPPGVQSAVCDMPTARATIGETLLVSTIADVDNEEVFNPEGKSNGSKHGNDSNQELSTHGNIGANEEKATYSSKNHGGKSRSTCDRNRVGECVNSNVRTRSSQNDLKLPKNFDSVEVADISEMSKSPEQTLKTSGWALKKVFYGRCMRSIWVSPDRKIQFTCRKSAVEFENVRKNHGGNEFKGWDHYVETKRSCKQQLRVRNLPQLDSSNESKADNDSASGCNVRKTNENECYLCGEGGVLVCCDYCEKSFHLICHVPRLHEVPKDKKWKCCECLAQTRKIKSRCGECKACMRPNCGTCVPCRDKKEFGGSGSYGSACKFKKCSFMRYAPPERTRDTRNSSQIVDGIKTRRNRHRGLEKAKSHTIKLSKRRAKLRLVAQSKSPGPGSRTPRLTAQTETPGPGWKLKVVTDAGVARRGHWLSPTKHIEFKCKKAAIEFEIFRQKHNQDEEIAWSSFVKAKQSLGHRISHFVRLGSVNRGQLGVKMNNSLSKAIVRKAKFLGSGWISKTVKVDGESHCRTHWLSPNRKIQFRRLEGAIAFQEEKEKCGGNEYQALEKYLKRRRESGKRDYLIVNLAMYRSKQNQCKTVAKVQCRLNKAVRNGSKDMKTNLIQRSKNVKTSDPPKPPSKRNFEGQVQQEKATKKQRVACSENPLSPGWKTYYVYEGRTDKYYEPPGFNFSFRSLVRAQDFDSLLQSHPNNKSMALQKYVGLVGDYKQIRNFFSNFKKEDYPQLFGKRDEEDTGSMDISSRCQDFQKENKVQLKRKFATDICGDKEFPKHNKKNKTNSGTKVQNVAVKNDNQVYSTKSILSKKIVWEYRKLNITPPARSFTDNGYTYELISSKVPRDSGSQRFAQKIKMVKLTYIATEGNGIKKINLQKELEKLCSFSTMKPEKIAARLSHLQAEPRGTLDINFSCIEEIKDMGHEGCGFFPEGFFGSGKSPLGKCDAIQVRIIGPRVGMMKGMLLKKSGISRIQIPKSMIKAPVSKSCSDTKVTVILKNSFPSDQNIQFGKFLALEDARQSWRNETKKPLSKMYRRMLAGYGVPERDVNMYARRAGESKHLRHAHLKGVADPTGQLPEGTVFISGYVKSNGRGREIFGKAHKKVFLTRSPSVEATDAKVVTVIGSKPKGMDKDGWELLCSYKFGTIIFGFPNQNSKHRTPLPCIIADGDLDGDDYFVLWDDRILTHLLTSRNSLGVKSRKLLTSLEPQMHSKNSVKKSGRVSGKEDSKWLIKTQEGMLDFDTQNVGQQMIGRLYTLCTKIRNIHDNDACALGKAYKDALDIPKHGGKISLPKHLKHHFSEEECCLISFR